MKTEIPDEWCCLGNKSAYPYENLKTIDDFQNTVTNLTKEDIFSNLKIAYPGEEEIERTKEIIDLFNIENRGKLTKPYRKSTVVLLTCVFEKFIKVSVTKLHINLLYCVSFFRFTWPFGMKHTGISLQTL